MSGSIYDWSKVADDNQTADADINWLENQLPGTVNGSARVMMKREAELRDDLGGALVPTGSANALTITANSAFTAYQQGLRIAFKAASTNTGAVTANVNGLGSKAIRKQGASADVALVAGDIVADGIFVLHYSTAANSAAGAWMLLNPKIDTSSFATLAGTETLTNKTLTSPTETGGTYTGGAFNGTLGATTPSTIAGTSATFSGTMSVTGAVTLSNNLTLTGILTVGTTFASSTATAIFAPNGPGNILLRPNGAGSPAGATTIASSGAVTINGTLTVTG